MLPLPHFVLSRSFVLQRYFFLWASFAPASSGSSFVSYNVVLDAVWVSHMRLSRCFWLFLYGHCMQAATARCHAPFQCFRALLPDRSQLPAQRPSAVWNPDQVRKTCHCLLCAFLKRRPPQKRSATPSCLPGENDTKKNRARKKSGEPPSPSALIPRLPHLYAALAHLLPRPLPPRFFTDARHPPPPAWPSAHRFKTFAPPTVRSDPTPPSPFLPFFLHFVPLSSLSLFSLSLLHPHPSFFMVVCCC